MPAELDRRRLSLAVGAYFLVFSLSIIVGGCGGAPACAEPSCAGGKGRSGVASDAAFTVGVKDEKARQLALQEVLKESEEKYQCRGEKDAPVTMVEFSDYECPFCGQAQATVVQIMESYPGKVRLVFKDFPLSFHRFAAKAAEATHCAADQGKFWEMHEMLFENSYALREMDLKAYAADLGLDAGRFDACLDSSEKAPVVEGAKTLAAKLGLSGAPSFFINGRLVTGAQPFEVFEEIIDDELRKAGR